MSDISYIDAKYILEKYMTMEYDCVFSIKKEIFLKNKTVNDETRVTLVCVTNKNIRYCTVKRILNGKIVSERNIHFIDFLKELIHLTSDDVNLEFLQCQIRNL